VAEVIGGRVIGDRGIAAHWAGSHWAGSHWATGWSVTGRGRWFLCVSGGWLICWRPPGERSHWPQQTACW